MGEVANETPTMLVADADALDYRESDLDVLTEAGRRIAQLAVLPDVLEEVRNLTPKKCESLGIKVIDVEMRTLEAAAAVEASVSFKERLCLVVCQEQGWTCVTNDVVLRRLCRRHDVKVRHGLGLLVDLVGQGVINRARANVIARRMHVNECALEKFTGALNGAG